MPSKRDTECYLTMAHFDVLAYVRRPCIGAHSGVVLSIRLIRAAPRELRELEYESLAELRSAAQLVQVALAAHRGARAMKTRPIDRRFDGAWAALYGRLVACTGIIDEDESRRARTLLETLFPSGLAFLSNKSEPQWVHSEVLLQRIRLEGAERQLAQLVGGRYLDYVRTYHAQLGAELGLDQGFIPLGRLAALGAQVDVLADTVASYGRVLAGGVRPRDPASLARFHAALAPLDSHRAKYGGGPTLSGAPELDEESELDECAGSEEDVLDLHAPLPQLPQPQKGAA